MKLAEVILRNIVCKNKRKHIFDRTVKFSLVFAFADLICIISKFIKFWINRYLHESPSQKTYESVFKIYSSPLHEKYNTLTIYLDKQPIPLFSKFWSDRSAIQLILNTSAFISQILTTIFS